MPTTLPTLLAPAHAAYQTALRHPQRTQAQILRTILRSNQHSQFGQQHHFAHIRSPEDYAQRVPIQSYDTLAPSIARHAGGEANILTSSPVIQFEETGGSTAGAKLIPYTAPLLTAFQHGIHAWFADLIAQRPHAFSGCLYFIISPATRSRSHTAGGIPIGTGNDLNYLGSALAEHIAPQTLYHPRLAEQQSPESWQIRTAALLAQSPNLSLISAWSPTLLLNIIHTLHQQQDRILSQIPDAARRRTLAQALAPAVPNTQKIWARLDTISCWDSHTAAAPAAQLRQLFPHAHLQGKGLLATEGITTLPFSGCLLPALTSHYYEFADEHGQIRPLHQLQHGNRYRLILTTQGGLYRYDTQDWLLVQASPHANVPSLHFIGRSSLTSDLVGEKLTEAFVAHAIPQALAPFSGCLFLQGSTTPQPHYILWHEPTFTPSENALAALNTALCANPQYHYAQQIGQLGNLTARPHPQLLAYASQHAPSRVLGTQKIPMLLPPIT
ncbi:GH3 auxin-responsive promoter family protein [Kingella oralis]|jgi:hypothetical protein|uniref:GH3 family domain-containing protein n=1 Tax=Kingella oralis TaxID=505 RepID=UPI0028F06076|nr:GH3 auxin-responsive promoter family protein [Kingella oralis]